MADSSYLPMRPTMLAVTFLSCSLLAYVVVLAIYRLYFHPLAKFPGPKLAGLTRWYEFYYELVQKGQYTFHIQKLHDQYGPIIRVCPDEIHIRDSDYYEELFVKSGKLDKPWTFCNRFGTADTFFSTPSHEHHKSRRGAVSQFFSKRRIMDYQPMIRSKLKKLIEKLAAVNGTGKVVRLDRAFTAFAGDVVDQFSFARSFDHLDSPDFTKTYHEAMEAACKSSTLLAQFPQLWPIMNSLPDSVVENLAPEMALHIEVQKDFNRTISQIKDGINDAHKEAEHPTLFHEMLNSSLPESEKTVLRMQQEAQVIIGAAILTTSWAMSVAAFHLISNPVILKKLRAELIEAIPDVSYMPAYDWSKLEALPYLTGVVREGIRLAYGIASRIPRVPHKDLVYQNYTIPAGSTVSMTIVDMNHNEEVYPESFDFVPERWIDPPKINGNPIEKYFVGFGKGARSCIGLNLAQAQLYMCLAGVFRQFDFELFETDGSDVALAHDYFKPCPKLDSLGVRAKVIGMVK